MLAPACVYALAQSPVPVPKLISMYTNAWGDLTRGTKKKTVIAQRETKQTRSQSEEG